MNNYSIGVVTYHARFEKYFIPLIEKLADVFPDKEILCILNGHPDQELQKRYLNKATDFLNKFKNVRYKTYDYHQSLSKCWNQVIIMSRTEKVLLMNDDTQVADLFRDELEKKIINKDINFSTINSSWSHFLISKSTIKKVGWFDERLPGIGHEDADYSFRMVMNNLPVTNTECLGVKNYVAEQENVSWKNISENGKTSGRYSEANEQFFRTKWWHSDLDLDFKDWKYSFVWNNIEYKFAPKTSETTPFFYEYSVLDTNNIPFLSNVKVKDRNFKKLAQKAIYSTREILKKIYRSLRR